MNALIPTHKVCKRCGGDPKPLGDFYPDTRLRDGRQNICSACSRELNRKAAKKRWPRASKRTTELAAEANRNAVRVLPMTRGECPPVKCGHVSCRFHTAIDVSMRTGTLRLVFGSEDPDDWPDDVCALNFAERGRMKLEEIAGAMGMTRERVRQIEESALRKLRNDARVLKVLAGVLEER